MTKKATQDNIQLAKYIAHITGLNPEVNTYLDNEEKLSIEILHTSHPTDQEISTFSTIGLSDYENVVKMEDNKELNIPIELLMVGHNEYNEIPFILSSSSFFMINNKWEAQPGTVFKDVISMYYPEKEMKHALLVAPFLWADKFNAIKLDKKLVNFLLCIPISDEELEYRFDRDLFSLEQLFAENKIDIFDFDRKSVI